MNNIKNIYIFRHGETNMNVCGTIMGQDKELDTYLTENGYNQISGIIDNIKDKKIDAIFTSDMQRTISTAEIINQNLIVPLYITTELRGLNMGNFQGYSIDELINSEEARKCFDNHDLAFTNGESINQLNKRLLNFVNKVCIETNYNNILLITHSAAMSNLKSFLCQEPYEAITECHLIWNDGKLIVSDFSKNCVDRKELVKQSA